MACRNQKPEKKTNIELLNQMSFSSISEESVANSTFGSSIPPPLTTRPSCFSSPSSSYDAETQNCNSTKENNFVAKLQSSQVFGQEEVVISLRNITRTGEQTGVSLCSGGLLLLLPLSFFFSSISSCPKLGLFSSSKAKNQFRASMCVEQQQNFIKPLRKW